MGSMPSGKSRCGAHLDAWKLSPFPLLWSLDPEGIISPLPGAVEREWEQKRPVLHFGNAHGAQGSRALGWSCHLLAFARLGGGTWESKSLKSGWMSCLKPNNYTQSRESAAAETD